jgi:hypothetical protein
MTRERDGLAEASRNVLVVVRHAGTSDGWILTDDAGHLFFLSGISVQAMAHPAPTAAMSPAVLCAKH